MAPGCGGAWGMLRTWGSAAPPGSPARTARSSGMWGEPQAGVEGRTRLPRARPGEGAGAWLLCSPSERGGSFTPDTGNRSTHNSSVLDAALPAPNPSGQACGERESQWEEKQVGVSSHCQKFLEVATYSCLKCTWKIRTSQRKLRETFLVRQAQVSPEAPRAGDGSALQSESQLHPHRPPFCLIRTLSRLRGTRPQWGGPCFPRSPAQILVSLETPKIMLCQLAQSNGPFKLTIIETISYFRGTQNVENIITNTTKSPAGLRSKTSEQKRSPLSPPLRSRLAGCRQTLGAAHRRPLHHKQTVVQGGESRHSAQTNDWRPRSPTGGQPALRCTPPSNTPVRGCLCGARRKLCLWLLL